jgi:hypothetical protein
MPDLTSGAMKAARVAVRKGMQSARAHSATTRFYPHLEVGDVVELRYILPATREAKTYRVIIESLTPNIGKGSSLQIRGRELL